ncbi:MAG: Asp-tRNA(Asn)/Glu-tRNA(Gln) amidotransferase subunit GatC [Candidatus Nitrohelix vancouverensis]|uniref:Glutamyl-tRNA(Gln) amidotransferase subunit C n=1 Tax=Candidatus Nitrohelix vancouverensis TaxID=2705534 RepID=A0A7T0C541_9BACT|nr:MAG: Asp-tRNA(Asn)/Glu-tRNA(Gln) amidotransferase subunit GatC [Candidatus Nitrohelix vancouverensis]
MTDKFDIDAAVSLSRLKLEADEKQRLEKDLEAIVSYIDQLNTLNTDQVEPTSHVLPIQNVFREDIPDNKFGDSPCLPLAPAHDKGHYEVPQII